MRGKCCHFSFFSSRKRFCVFVYSSFLNRAPPSFSFTTTHAHINECGFRNWYLNLRWASLKRRPRSMLWMERKEGPFWYELKEGEETHTQRIIVVLSEWADKSKRKEEKRQMHETGNPYRAPSLSLRLSVCDRDKNVNRRTTLATDFSSLFPYLRTSVLVRSFCPCPSIPLLPFLLPVDELMIEVKNIWRSRRLPSREKAFWRFPESSFRPNMVFGRSSKWISELYGREKTWQGRKRPFTNWIKQRKQKVRRRNDDFFSRRVSKSHSHCSPARPLVVIDSPFLPWW